MSQSINPHNTANDRKPMVMPPSSRITLAIGIGLVLVGCSRGPKMAEVKGQITLDGNPLETASIRFAPIDGNGSTAGSTVANGKFEVVLPATNYRVQVSAVAPLPAGTPKDAKHRYEVGLPDTPELIPAKYNTNSELTLELKEGLNEPRFDLLSK